MKKTIHVGVNITPNELTEQLFLRGKLPKNYEVKSFDLKGFNKYLTKLKENFTVKPYDINGESSLEMDSENELVVIFKK
jgi:hypothetical protein